MKLLIKNGTLVTARRERRGDLLVEDGRIAAVDACLEVPGAEVIDAAGCLVFPGFIDAHTHLDMECAAGVTADDFATGTRAALAGGTTTILDFATQGKGQTLVQGLAAWESKAAGKALCDYGFHMAITHWTDDIPAQMEEMCRRGVTSFKVYLAYDDLRLTPEQIGKVLEATARLGAVVGAHCEDGDAVNAGIAGQKALGNLAPAAHPASRPNWVEADAVRQFLDLAKRAGAEAYVVHLSTWEGLEAVREARRAGQTVWAETCPHYLALEESLYLLPGFEGAKFVCSPPLRSREDRRALWAALQSGEIQTVATDHCSFRFDGQKSLGREDFSRIPNGLPGIEHRGAVLASLVPEGEGLSPQQLCGLLSEGPARIFGMYPSESCEEKEVVACIKAEMEKLGYDQVEVDGLGNIIGWMGTGDKIIAIDSHIDTVGIGNRDNWTHDPYEGYEDDQVICGRGGSDQEGGMASAVYGARIMKDLGLIPQGYKIMVVGSVQEEDCDGMCWQYIVNRFFPQKGIQKEQVEFVISTEPTDGGIYRGHRGRMEIRVDVKGVSCHGSAPERGDNAIYKMADILQDVRALNENDDADTTPIKGLVKMLSPKHNPEHYEDARFLGRGTCTTSQIFYTSPSRCAVADSCSISIDRRMTAGETWDSCLQEIRDLPAVKKYGEDVKVSMYMYDRPSWTGEVYETGSYFPTWINKETAAHVQALVDAHHALFGEKRVGPDGAMVLRDRPLTDKWTFSTNGVAIQGRYGIPCVGFGPGAESQAHAPNEITWKDDLVRCAALYAAVPGLYREDKKTADVTQFRAGKTGNDIQ